MSGRSESRRLQALVGVRFDNADLRRLQREARAGGLTVPSLIRQRALAWLPADPAVKAFVRNLPMSGGAEWHATVRRYGCTCDLVDIGGPADSRQWCYGIRNPECPIHREENA